MFKMLNFRGAGRSDRETFLLSTRHFQAALARERSRSDRTLLGFSLLTLQLAPRNASANTSIRALAQMLEQRVRATDTAGWCGERQVGIILPDTPVAGAWKLADDLRGPLSELELAVQFHVYEYPSRDGDENEALEENRERESADSDHPRQPLETLFAKKLSPGKRLIDIGVSSVAILAVLPVILLAALAVKLTSPGPIFFAQQRDGLAGRRFWIYKFRTMVVNAEGIKAQLRAMSEQDGPAFKLKNDPRVTSMGRLLRRSCIDELPQLWNVLRGDMSLVGPRPLPCDESSRCEPWQRRRLEVTPGLTCIWQVYGGTKVTFMEWMRMDLRYIRSRSMWNDVRLMILTVPSVIRRDGVY